MITKIKCLFGFHKWNRVSQQFMGLGHMDECEHCGRGSYFFYAGYASTVGKLSRAEMQEWRRKASTSLKGEGAGA